MNGMQYLQHSFTLPAGSNKISDQKWDLAFMSREEFMAKYEISEREYDEIVKG
jgi:hypothetical protein